METVMTLASGAVARRVDVPAETSTTSAERGTAAGASDASRETVLRAPGDLDVVTRASAVPGVAVSTPTRANSKFITGTDQADAITQVIKHNDAKIDAAETQARETADARRDLARFLLLSSNYRA